MAAGRHLVRVWNTVTSGANHPSVTAETAASIVTRAPNSSFTQRWGPSTSATRDCVNFTRFKPLSFCFSSKIYKSTKCNDIRQNGYCPRGPFCAFAHVGSKIFLFIHRKHTDHLPVPQLKPWSFQELLPLKRPWAHCWRWSSPDRSLSWAPSSIPSVPSASGTADAIPALMQPVATDRWAACVCVNGRPLQKSLDSYLS